MANPTNHQAERWSITQNSNAKSQRGGEWTSWGNWHNLKMVLTMKKLPVEVKKLKSLMLEISHHQQYLSTKQI